MTTHDAAFSPGLEVSTDIDDRRGAERATIGAKAHLVGWGGSEPIECQVDNIACGGLFVRAADSPELGVGRRYEVVVQADSDSSGTPSRDLADMVGDGCYATVIRTEVIGTGDDKMIGAGLRFDQPLML